MVQRVWLAQWQSRAEDERVCDHLSPSCVLMCMFTIIKNTKNDEQNALRRSTVYSQCMQQQVYRLPFFLNTVWLCVVDASIKYSASKNEIIVSRWWLFCVFLLNCSACFSFSRHYKISFTRPVLLRPAVTSTHARTNARTHADAHTYIPIYTHTQSE